MKWNSKALPRKAALRGSFFEKMQPMKRIFFALFKGLKYRACLKNMASLKKILDLTPEFLTQHNIEVLILDFDGVLSSHGETLMHPESLAWLKAFAQQWGEENIVVLSNKPTLLRIKAFHHEFPNIAFVQGVAKKPYPEGILKAAALKKVPTKKCLLADDRVLTGMLACCLSGAKGLLITKPYKTISSARLLKLSFLV